MISWLVNDLLRCLKRTRMKKIKIVVLPDFFLDRFVEYPGSLKQLCKALTEIAQRKGGIIYGFRQTEMRGGNAANTASALAALGAKVYPIITTNPLGMHLLKFYLEPFSVDLSYTKTNGTLQVTTALECTHEGERVNIMMSDLGSLPEFSVKDLTPKDFQLLAETDYVCVFHWSGMRWGTDLAEGVFHHVKEKGKGKTYLDTADPAPQKTDIPELMKKVLTKDLVDVFSVNENEAFWYASYFSESANRLKKTLKTEDLAKEHARILAKNLPVRIDLHTSTFAGSFTSKTEVLVPAFEVSTLRATGAGDAWNAGNIMGDALSLPDTCRLTLANAAAAYYISNATGEHSTLPKLVEFCQRQQ